jgi:hypothetical protein
MAYEVLPYLTLEDLVNLSISSSDDSDIQTALKKFVKNYLKMRSICDLREMKYFTTYFQEPKFTYKNSNKPKLDPFEYSNLCLKLVDKALDLIKENLFK